MRRVRHNDKVLVLHAVQFSVSGSDIVARWRDRTGRIDDEMTVIECATKRDATALAEDLNKVVLVG